MATKSVPSIPAHEKTQPEVVSAGAAPSTEGTANISAPDKESATSADVSDVAKLPVPPTDAQPRARTNIDRAVEQRLAEHRFLELVRAGMEQAPNAPMAAMGIGGSDFYQALAKVKAHHPRLWAMKEGDFDKDAELAAAGHAHPIPDLLD